MFAEGSTTNGTELMKFRRGAFIGEKRVSPMYFKYHVHGFSTAYDVIDFLPLVFMNLCYFGLKCDVNIMPDFEPNEYLFTKHADKGQERWEVFAWAVRDVMAKSGDFGFSNLKLSEKIAYYKFMTNVPGYEDPFQDPETMQKLLASRERDRKLNNQTTTAYDHVERTSLLQSPSRASRGSARSREMKLIR